MDLDDYYIGKIPLPNNKIDNSVFINVTNRMLLLNERISTLGDKGTDEYARIEEEMKRIDEEINQIIYKVYGLTKKEVQIVEIG